MLTSFTLSFIDGRYEIQVNGEIVYDGPYTDEARDVFWKHAPSDLEIGLRELLGHDPRDERD